MKDGWELEKEREEVQTVGWIGAFFMTLYWGLVLYFGYPVFTERALAATLGVLIGATTSSKDKYTGWKEFLKKEFWKEFLAQVGNNNWVLRTAFFMAVAVVFLWWRDPNAPSVSLNPLKLVWSWGKESVATLLPLELEDPLGRTGFWEAITLFFFGVKTIGWGVVAFHLWAVFFAIPVSRWDEVLAGGKETKSEKAHKETIGKIFGHHVIGEIFEIPFKLIWVIIKAPFRAFFKK